jgi:hypothetical protein
VDRDVPVGLSDIALRFELDTDADATTVQRLVELSERFCVSTDFAHAAPAFGYASDRGRTLTPGLGLPIRAHVAAKRFSPAVAELLTGSRGGLN